MAVVYGQKVGHPRVSQMICGIHDRALFSNLLNLRTVLYISVFARSYKSRTEEDSVYVYMKEKNRIMINLQLLILLYCLALAQITSRLKMPTFNVQALLFRFCALLVSG